MVQGLFCYVMQKIVFCFSICIFSYSFLKGQSYFSRLLETPYPYLGALLGSIETPDSGFLMMHTSFDIFQDTNKINIVKIDKNGETVWAKSYGAAGTAHDQYEIIRTKDSCYVFCGDEWIGDTLSAFLFKINEQGDSLWMKTYNNNSYLCLFGKVEETKDGGLIAIGGCDKTTANGSDPWRQIYIVRTDKDGNLKWQKNYGSASLNDNGRDIVETPEGDFICSGYVRYPYSTNDFFVYGQLMKIDSMGNVKWTKNYSIDEYWQGFIEINRTLDGNYLATGGYANNRYVLTSDPNGTGGILLKIDGDGNTLWFKRYGDEILDAECYDFVELPDSSIVTIGFSTHPESNSTMVKFDKTGDIKWLRTYKYNTEFDASEELFEIIHTKDNGFLLCGTGVSPILTDPLAIAKGWILKVDSLGCEIPLCVVGTEEPGGDTGILQVWPNPFTRILHIRLPDEHRFETLGIYDIAGKLKMSQRVERETDIEVDTQTLSNGWYVLKITSDKNSITRKIIKIE
jgi:Secretion system C-terminal sorting domain